jgi:uncharacterized protein (DUF3820 family)
MASQPPGEDASPQVLMEFVSVTMPYGRYKGRLLCDLPEPYLVWMHGQGFPKGRIGLLLATLFEIKANGLEYLLRPLRKSPPPSKAKPGAGRRGPS